jgi:serine/threonine protein kinase
MEVDPSERITAQEASSHDWITKKDRENDCHLPLVKENFNNQKSLYCTYCTVEITVKTARRTSAI